VSTDALIVILKMSEGCPLACDYCYYFRNIVNPHKSRPLKIEKDITQKLCDRIAEFNEFNENDKILHVSFSLHGGEPLFVGKDHFVEMCDVLAGNLKTSYSLRMQTNAVLIDKEWIEIFKKYNIKVGISIDGPEEYQNVHRKLKDGSGSFNVVDKNMRMCVDEELDLGVLMVADPSFDPQKIWNYLIDDVGIKNMDILLRDYTHDTLPSQQYANVVSDYLVKWINIWLIRDDETVGIRTFDNIVNVLLGRPSLLEFSFEKNKSTYPTITMYTNGDVSPADELASTSGNLMDIGKSILKNSFEDIFSAEIFKELADTQQNIPKDCNGCCWKYACRGGYGILEKFSSRNRFSNKSVYCKVWSSLFPIVASSLLKHGYPKEKLLKVLNGENR
jgi:uncharacterized protein